MKRIGDWIASGTLVATLMLSMTSAPFCAEYRVDCDRVMSEFRRGKQPNQIASDLRIHENSVHRCIRAAARTQRRTRQAATPATSK
jgi:uncharacterized protein (DUF433 family)